MRKKLRYIVLFILCIVFSANCNDYQLCKDKELPIHVVISNSFAPEEKVLIKNAIDEWNKAFGATVLTASDHAIEITDYESEIPIEPVYRADTNYDGITSEYCIKILINMYNIKRYKNYETKEFYMTILHEFGHALGANTHSTNKDSLMSYGPKLTNCIDQDSINLVCSFRDCSEYNIKATCYN